ncbi:MAG: TIGR03936 family radical SAM-associated protein, partial [bacterium]
MVRLRIRYEKRRAIRFTSHRDLMRIFRRCFAAAEMPIRFSQGFNPHPRFSFGPSLRTGWESLDEYMDVILETPVDDVAGRCNRYLPAGLQVLETAEVAGSVPKLGADIEAVGYAVCLDAAAVSDAQLDRTKRTSGPTASGAGPRGMDSGLAANLEAELRRRFGVDGQLDGPSDAQTTQLPVIREISVLEVAEPAPDSLGREEPGLQIDYMSTMHGGRSVPPE